MSTSQSSVKVSCLTMNREIDRPKNKATDRQVPLRKSWRRRLLYPLLAIGCGGLFAVVIGEVALRVFVEQEAKRLATYDETLGWRGRPNGDGVYIRKIDDIRVPFHYNNLGFRDEDIGPKPSHARRLMLLGDSFVENLEVEYEKTFPARLEQNVKARHEAWEVAVVGSQGYSTSQELLAFRKYRELISPDVTLLCFYCGNDFDDNLRRHFAYLDDDGRLQLPTNTASQWEHRGKQLQRWLYESSHLVFLLKNSLQSALDVEFAPAAKDAIEADSKYKQAISGELIALLNEEVQAIGSEFGVIVIPHRDDLIDGDDSRQRYISQFCEENDIAHLDLSPFLTAKDFFGTDIHFNAAGHEQVAKAIDGFVVNSFRGSD